MQWRKDAAALFFEDVRLPASALLGQENKGFYYLMNELPQERLTIGIHATAHAEFMFEETKQYVMQRKAYGKTLSHLQVRSHFFPISETPYFNVLIFRQFNIN